jgi:hypothetical protein
MAKIRNPQAYAAWLARKQMALTQQQNVSTYNQGGVPDQTRQNLTEEMVRQAAYQEAMDKQSQISAGTPEARTASDQLFGGKSIFEGNIFR